MSGLTAKMIAGLVLTAFSGTSVVAINKFVSPLETDRQTSRAARRRGQKKSKNGGRQSEKRGKKGTESRISNSPSEA